MISVNYRLAPEHTFPSLLNDCWDALIWAVGQAELIAKDEPRPLIFTYQGYRGEAGRCLFFDRCIEAR